MDAPERTSIATSAKLAAGFAVFLSYISAAIMLSIEHENRFIRFYAYQSICVTPFLVLAVLSELGSKALGFLASDSPLEMPLHLVSQFLFVIFLALWVIMLITALTGKIWAVPLGIGAFSKRRAGIS